MKRIDISKKRFNRLTVMKYAFTKNGKAYWLCECDCSNTVILQGDRIKRGVTKSCGCFAVESSIQSGRNKKGRTWGKRLYIKHKAEYSVWCGMKRRCYNSNEDSFQYYGKRGIKVCQRYRNSFEDFFNDIGKRPNPRLQIDRIDNEGHYSCGKCAECKSNRWKFNIRWTTLERQSRNKRNNHLITFNGETKCLTDFAKEVGKSYSVVYARIKRGWTVQNALTVPIRPCKK